MVVKDVDYECVMWLCYTFIDVLCGVVYMVCVCVLITLLCGVFLYVLTYKKKLSAAKITRRVMVMNVSHINIFKAPNLFLHWEYFQFIPPIFVSCFSNYHILYPFLPENLFPSPFQSLFVLEGNPDNNLGQIPQTPISDIQ